jgi:biotin carboxyl carrier protein
VVDGTPIKLKANPKLDEIVYKNTGGGGSADAQTNLHSQIPGKVVSINVNEGDSVKKGDVVCVLESMKMQVSIKSHKDGVVKKIKIKGGGSVAKNDVLAEIE